MVHFICRPVQETDDAGYLSASGLHWNEGTAARNSSDYAMLWLFVIFLGGASLVFIFIAWAADRVWLSLAALPLLAVAGWLVRILFSSPPERCVMFHADGRITAPLGLPRHPKMQELPFAQEDVSTIELGPSLSGYRNDFTRTVRIITRFGQTLPIGSALHEEHAHEVVVRLTLALKEIRSAVGETARTATAGSDVID